MNPVLFLQDLAVVLSVAAVVLLIFRQLGQPPVLGYLAAGLIVGPHTPPSPLVSDIKSLETLAEVGVVFLMFALGVEYNLRRLARAGARALSCASIEAGLMLAIGAGIGLGLGWGARDGLLLGGIISVSSTAIVARTLLDRSRGRFHWEEFAAGKLIAEDMIAVALIAFFSADAGLGTIDAQAIGATLLRFGSLVIVLLLVGLIVLPRLLEVVERAGMEEVRSLVVIGACFAVSLLTLKLGYSAALGAFLAGALSSVGSEPGRLHAIVAPFKDVFGAVFFVSVGMLIDPAWLVGHWPVVIGLALFVVAARAAANFAAFILAGETAISSAQAAIVMLPVGEFSFILAQLAQRERITERPFYPVAVALCLATTLASARLLPIATEERLGRAIPGWVDRAIDVYRRALATFSVPGRAAQVWALIRPSVIQILLNAVGISGFFLALRALAERLVGFELFPGALWIIATLVSLPFVNALLRKTQAVVLILLEAVTGAPPVERYPWRTRLVLAAAAVCAAWWYLSISLFLLPPWPYAPLPVLFIVVAALALWRRTSRVYGLLQAALRESIGRAGSRPETAAAALSVFVDSASPENLRITAYELGEDWWAAGRRIGELDLRSTTGTTLVQVNRAQASIPFLSPDRQLQSRDELLIIGEAGDLRRAYERLRFGPSEPFLLK